MLRERFCHPDAGGNFGNEIKSDFRSSLLRRDDKKQSNVFSMTYLMFLVFVVEAG